MLQSILTTMRAMAHGSFEPACRRLPTRAVAETLGRSTKDLHVALCLHRVGERVRQSDPLPNQTISPHALDELIDLVRRARELGGGPKKLTLTFDDGYRDAVRYVRDRAPDCPDIEWLVFVCPEKLLTRAAFRWDLWEHDPTTRGSRVRLEAMQRDTEPLRENSRAELRSLGDRPEYALATVEECRALLDDHGVSLGNHTNTHLALSTVSEEVARLEIRLSMNAFESLFGGCSHFAFPFGVPGRDFRPSDVRALRELAPATTLWSTEGRLHHPHERTAMRVLPRIPAPGRFGGRALAMWIARMRRRPMPGSDDSWRQQPALCGPDTRMETGNSSSKGPDDVASALSG